jgi:hypothetical protein
MHLKLSWFTSARFNAMKNYTTQSVLMLFTLLMSVFVASHVANAQQSRFCQYVQIPIAKTNRVAQLKNFGIEVTIPSNSRVLARSDGSVDLLTASDFEHVQCIARGGWGGRGMYFESLRLYNRNADLTLKQQIYRLATSRGQRVEALVPISWQNLQGYRVIYPILGENLPYGQAAWVLLRSGRILKISAACDCEVSEENLTDLLNRIRLLTP